MDRQSRRSRRRLSPTSALRSCHRRIRINAGAAAGVKRGFTIRVRRSSGRAAAGPGLRRLVRQTAKSCGTNVPLVGCSEIPYHEEAETQTPPRGSGEGGGHHEDFIPAGHHRTGAGAPRPGGDPMLVEEAGEGTRRSRGEAGIFAFFGLRRASKECSRGWSEGGVRPWRLGIFAALKGGWNAAGPGPAAAAPHSEEPGNQASGRRSGQPSLRRRDRARSARMRPPVWHSAQ